MTLTEKAAYIKGLMDASELDKTSKEGKILAAVVDLLDDMALTVSDLEDTCAELDEYVEELDMDLGEMEKDIYGDEDEHGDGCDCGCDDDGYHYQTECPNCGEDVLLDEEILQDGMFECPHCGETIDFGDDVEVEQDECGCGCGEEEDGSCGCGCGGKDEK